MLRIDIAALFPEICDFVLRKSMTGRALERNLTELNTWQIRDFTENRQKQTEDLPYGGGPGKLMMAQPVCDCAKAIIDDVISCGHPAPRILFLSAAGEPFTQKKARELAAEESLLFICGHYEGIDARAAELLHAEEISIGDYVMTGGELAACVVADSVLRLLPGVLKTPESYEDESYWEGLLEYPQYTRPQIYQGLPVPDVLLSGDHEKIRAWRKAQSLEKTRLNRPDLYHKYLEKEPPET